MSCICHIYIPIIKLIMDVIVGVVCRLRCYREVGVATSPHSAGMWAVEC